MIRLATTLGLLAGGALICAFQAPEMAPEDFELLRDTVYSLKSCVWHTTSFDRRDQNIVICVSLSLPGRPINQGEEHL